jgi:Uma2 family endonuclease
MEVSGTIVKSEGPGAAMPERVLCPLESGDRLSAAEFERRFRAMPDLKKAELVEGVVFLTSPVRGDIHGGPHADLMAWLGVFRAMTPGVRSYDNATVRLDDENVIQPDGSLLLDIARGGQATIDEEGYISGAPELCAEISASSASLDLNAKFRVCRTHGVREYIVWRVFDRELDWFVLRNADFVRLALSEDGLLKSAIFPGLWLDPAALLRGDLATVLQRLHDGLASAEHATFVGQTPGATGA